MDDSDYINELTENFIIKRAFIETRISGTLKPTNYVEVFEIT